MYTLDNKIKARYVLIMMGFFAGTFIPGPI